MRVVYKKSISEKLDEAIVEAKILNKTIEHIALTREEYEELYCAMARCLVPDRFYVFNVAENKTYCGVKLVVEEDSDDSVDELEKGLDLEQLAKKHNFVVVECRCCGSPLLEHTNGTYTYDRQIDWEENEKYD